jgi:hypothetical protein
MASPTPSLRANSTQCTSNAVPSAESDASSGRPKPDSLPPCGLQTTASGASSKSRAESGSLGLLSKEALRTPGVTWKYRFVHNEAPVLDWGITMHQIQVRHNVYHMMTAFDVLEHQPSPGDNAEQWILPQTQEVTCHSKAIIARADRAVLSNFEQSLMGCDKPFAKFLTHIHCSTAFGQDLGLSLL